MENMFSRYSYFFYLLFFVLFSCNNSPLNQARECYIRGDYKKALQIADSLTQNEPDNMAAIKLQGLCNYKLGNWVAAFHYIQIACRNDSTDTATISARAYLLFEMRQPQLALKDYKYVLSVNPKSAYVLNSMSEIYYTMHNIDSALYYANQAIDVDTNYVISYCNKAIILSDKGFDQQALQNFNKAIQKGYNSAEVYFGRGISYKKMNDLNLAKADFSRAIKLRPDDTSYHFQRGLVFDELNIHDSACNDWEFALSHGCIRAEPYVEKYCR
jgi:tetratricopeptide (TPR) repeat protein